MSERIGNLIIVVLSASIFAVMVLYVTMPSFSYYGGSTQIEGKITIGQANFEFVNEVPLFSTLENFTGGTSQYGTFPV